MTHPGAAHQVCCVGRVSDGWSGCNIQQRPLKRQVLWRGRERGRGRERVRESSHDTCKRDTPSGWSHTETSSAENLTHLISKTFCTNSSAEFHPQLITLCALLSVKSLKSRPVFFWTDTGRSWGRLFKLEGTKPESFERTLPDVTVTHSFLEMHSSKHHFWFLYFFGVDSSRFPWPATNSCV